MRTIPLFLLVLLFGRPLWAQMLPTESLPRDACRSALLTAGLTLVSETDSTIYGNFDNIQAAYFFYKNVLYVARTTQVFVAKGKAQQAYKQAVAELLAAGILPTHTTDEKHEKRTIGVRSGRVYRLELRTGSEESVLSLSVKFVNKTPITELDQVDMLELNEKQ